MTQPRQHPQERFTALDGLRGLAALSVFLGHSDFSLLVLRPFPAFLLLFQIFASGLVGVQILFVLSGFFMSLLYPVVLDKVTFWQKRYMRIFPLFIVIACFIWYANQAETGQNWTYKLLILGVFSWIVHTLWLGFRQFSATQKINWGRKIFFGFLGLQVLLICVNLLVTPHFVVFHQLHVSPKTQDVLLLFSNITLTTPFVNGVPLLTGTFWSLAPEVLFYLLYPVVVLPLVGLGKKHGWWISVLVIVAMTKIIFDVHTVSLGIADLQTMKIGRVTGFMVGVVIGSLYQLRHPHFMAFKQSASRLVPNVLIAGVFVFILWLNSTTQLGAHLDTLSWFHFVSSWVIGAVIIASLTPGSMLHKFFSFRIFTFLGMISYSFYLIHFTVIQVGLESMKFFGSRTSENGWYEAGALVLELLCSIILSWILYYFVERLYFTTKKSVPTQLAKNLEKKSKKNHSHLKPIISSLGITSFFLLVYAGGYSPSILVSHAPIPSSFISGNVSLLKQAVRFPVQAQNPSFSAVTIRLKYLEDAEKTRKKDAAQSGELIFRLYDASGTQQLFESRRHAYEVEGEFQFPFGFPTIAGSQKQTYIIELAQEKGDDKDQVLFDRSSSNVVLQYTRSQTSLPKYVLNMIVNRLLFALADTRFWFATGFSLVAIVLIHRRG